MIESDYDLGIFPPNDNLYCPNCGGAKTQSGQEWHAWNCSRDKAVIGELRTALMIAINTVECASLDKDGSELPWYAGAKAALRNSEGIVPNATITQFLADAAARGAA